MQIPEATPESLIQLVYWGIQGPVILTCTLGDSGAGASQVVHRMCFEN